MTPQQAVERLGTVLAHAWMVRTFLKHADEIQEDADMLEVPAEVNRLNDQVLVRYYEKEWKDIAR